MNTAQSAAVMRAPVRAARAAADESVAEESLSAHARRVLRSRLVAMACGVLDPCIGFLQGMRPRSGGAGDADDEEAEGRSSPRSGRPGRGRDTVADEGEAEAEAPKPKRRVRALLIYFCVMLAGGMGGGAIAFELLAKLLYRQGTDIQRLHATLSKNSKSAASNEKTLSEAQTRREQAEKKLEEAQARQAEAEKNLEAALNDAKAAAEKQKKLDEAVKLLESIRAADRSGNSQRPVPTGRSSKPRPPKSGDCNLVAGDLNALKDCVDDLNR